VQLRLKPPKGQTFIYESVIDASTALESYREKTTINIAIKDLTPTTVDVQVTRSQAKAESLDERTASKQQRKLDKEIGVPIEAELNLNAEIQSAAAMTPDMDLRKSMYDAFMASPGIFSLVYPPGKLVVGTHWTAYENYSILAQALGPLIDQDTASRVPVTYVLKGIEQGRDCTFAVIDYSSDATFGPKQGEGSQTLASLCNVAIKGSGTFRVDLSNGMLETDDWKMRLTLSFAGMDNVLRMHGTTRYAGVR